MSRFLVSVVKLSLAHPLKIDHKFGLSSRHGRRAVNSIKSLNVSDENGLVQGLGLPRGLVTSIFSTKYITFFNEVFQEGVNQRRVFIHETFHLTESLEAARLANPDGVHGMGGGFEQQRNKATDLFINKYHELLKEES